jgi:hypothetical protein
MRATQTLALLFVGTAIGIGIAALEDLSLARRSRRATAATATAGLHDAEERRLAREVHRFLLIRKDLDRRAQILAGLRDTPAFPEPIAAMRRALAWSDQHEVTVNSLQVAGGELRTVVATAEPGVVIALARDLMSRRLIESPEVRWTEPVDKGRRWLEVSGRLLLPRHQSAPHPAARMQRR